MATKRLDETVRRRLRAGRMLLAGKTPAEAAHAVGVARQTAYTWKAILDEGGIDALRAMPSRGRLARLDQQQLQTLGRLLLDKPTEHGFGTELWTPEAHRRSHRKALGRQVQPDPHLAHPGRTGFLG